LHSKKLQNKKCKSGSRWKITNSTSNSRRSKNTNNREEFEEEMLRKSYTFRKN
jgi:hypothetical protein